MTAMRPMADCIFFFSRTSSEGRAVAAEVDTYLQNSTRLPAAGGIKARVSTPPFHVLGLRSRRERAVHVLTMIPPLFPQQFVPPPSTLSPKAEEVEV